MALLLEVLMERQAQGLSRAPTDLWAWVRGDARLSRLVDAHEVLCAPLAAPWDLEGVEAACEVVTRTHRRIELASGLRRLGRFGGGATGARLPAV